MMKKMIALSMLLCVAFSLFGMGGEEIAFPNPEKVITVVVPFSAGGGTDLAFRPIVEEMKKSAGVNVVVSNIGGAGSSTGTNEVLSMEADGYTLLASGTHTIGVTMQGLTDGYEGLDGLAGLNWDPFIIAVHVDKPWNDFSELVEDAENNPGKISLGNAGMGGATGVASVGLNLAFDKVFNITPFNGGSDLRASVLGGHCDVGIFSQSEILSNRDMLRPLVMLYTSRSVLDGLKDVPTLSEVGYPEVQIPAGSFKSFSVKTGTPEDVKATLVDIITEAFNSDSYQKFMADNGLISAFTALNEYQEYENSLIAEYEPILKDAGLYSK